MMTNIIQNVNKAKFDSMSLSIPFNQCEILDQELTEEYVKFFPKSDTYSEVLEKPKSITITKFKGITLKISFNEMMLQSNGKFQKNAIRQRNIVLTLSAKLLKDRYFEGINKNNIEYLYNEFMKFGIFKCSPQTFLKALPNDIDICKDRYIESNLEFLNVCNSLIEQSEDNKIYAQLYNRKANLGLQFNHRDRAKPTKPYYKIYFKEYDLISKSKEFKKTYLNKVNTNNLMRVEATIKNSKHKKYLYKNKIIPEFTTLEELLNIPEKSKNELLMHSLNQYIMKKPKIDKDHLSPTNQIISELMSQCINNGYDKNQLIGLADYITLKNKATERRQILRAKERLRFLYQNLTDNNQLLIEKNASNESVNEVLKWLGVQI